MSKDAFSTDELAVYRLPSVISISTFDEILALADESGASDIMFRSGTAARARIDGSLRSITDNIIERDDIARYVSEAETSQVVTSVTSGRPRSFSYRVVTPNGIRRFRMSLASVNEGRSEQGLRLIARPISNRPPRLDSLNLPSALHEAIKTPNNKGIILITGETGSGKTTLLAAALDEKARQDGINIATLEDPIEYNLFYLNDETESLVSQSGIGSHVQTFELGLRGLLRDAPNVIMVGEMRDTETIKLSVEASRTGHLVYSTLHVANIASIVDRVCVKFDGDERNDIASTLVNSLRSAVNQELVARLCPKCSQSCSSIDPLLIPLQLNLENAKTVNNEPCDQCFGRGFNGRTPLIEYLVLTNEARLQLSTALMTDGIAGVTQCFQVLVDQFGQTKLQATINAFESGLISEDTLKHVYIEYQTMEALAAHGKG
ncbi:type IV pilus twitching motility protein PilT [Neptunomonas phycophila]